MLAPQRRLPISLSEFGKRRETRPAVATNSGFPTRRRLATNETMCGGAVATKEHAFVRNNIAFPLKTQRVARAEVENKVDCAANLLGISQLLDRRPRQLSGGERQRVALARALECANRLHCCSTSPCQT
jgi:multiple sugar transport system ATP-binding protein